MTCINGYEALTPRRSLAFGVSSHIFLSTRPPRAPVIINSVLTVSIYRFVVLVWTARAPLLGLLSDVAVGRAGSNEERSGGRPCMYILYGRSGRPVARCVSCKLLTSHTTCLECRPDVRRLADPGCRRSSEFWRPAWGNEERVLIHLRVERIADLVVLPKCGCPMPGSRGAAPLPVRPLSARSSCALTCSARASLVAPPVSLTLSDARRVVELHSLARRLADVSLRPAGSLGLRAPDARVPLGERGRVRICRARAPMVAPEPGAPRPGASFSGRLCAVASVLAFAAEL